MPQAPDEVVRWLAVACRTGDVTALLAPDAFAVCDGGGRVPAPILPLQGAAEVAWLLHALLPGNDLDVESVNGRAGLVLRRTGRAVAVIAVTCDHDHVTALWVVLNPAKLRAWDR
jgi:RNA polymerase sigma-70 factor (ECF subfamily)